MFKDVLQHADLTRWAEMGLVIFFLVFLGAVAWTFTRPRREVEQWATLPLSNELSSQERSTHE
jgi:cbb3-type cytochrome oxidase subunit 3